jgi:hypothetical protein
MGGGRAPAPTGLGSRRFIDEGTLARAASPAPGAIGLHGKGGAKEAGPHVEQESSTAPQAAPAVDPDASVAYAARVADAGEFDPHGHECVTLVDSALQAGGAMSYRDLGPTGAHDEYVWGDPVGFSELQPGDVIQFSGYVCVTTTVEGRRTYTERETRPHHSALVERAPEGGVVAVIEQNQPRGSVARHADVQWFDDTDARDGVTKRVTQGGTAFYRPRPALPE